MYYVLLVLFEEKYGSEIVEAVSELTNQRISLGPGTLYTILSQFEEERLIEETKTEGRKRSYCITDHGKKVLFNEVKRLNQMIEDAYLLSGIKK